VSSETDGEALFCHFKISYSELMFTEGFCAWEIVPLQAVFLDYHTP
jgi:hypothetical protein